MKCPHCNYKISLFSKTLNSLGKNKVCESCNETFKMSLNIKKAFIFLLPTLVVYFFIAKPVSIYFGITKGLSISIVCLTWCFASLELLPTEN